MANRTDWGEKFTPEQQAKAEQMNDYEDRVPAYTVPGPESATGAEFLQKERGELLKKLARYLYGPIPGRCKYLDFDIVSEEPERIRQYIVEKLVRGCSLYKIQGGYSGEEHTEIQALLTQDEFSSVMAFIRDNKIKAFITAGNCSEVYGLWIRHKKVHGKTVIVNE